jgi:glycosyltransferase involved in cell wall biosynthesis
MSGPTTERLRLALVTPRIVRGDGQGRVNYEIVRHALERGADVTVITEALAPELESQERLRWIRFGYASLPTSLLRSQIFSLQSGRWLAKNARRFDIVASNGSVTLATSDVNTAHFVHGAWSKSEAHTSRQHRNAYGLYHRLLTRTHAAQERIAYDRARRIVAISEQVKSQLATLGVAEEKISVIYNGVDTVEFAPGPPARADLGLPEGRFLALFAGDMTTPRKNLETVLAALPYAPDVHLVVVGSLRKNPYRVRALGLDDRVTFLGFRRDLPAIMRSVDAFVYPSRYEPLGLVVLEALASGLPVVTVRATGASELIGPDSGFVIAEAGDYRGLAEALARLASGGALRARMSLGARRTAERYTWNDMAERYYTLYESLWRARNESHER